MVASPPHQSVSHAAQLILDAQCAVALTGAGISTPSGIPDFRSPGTGLWEETDPMAVASLTAFRHTPAQFFEWMRPLARTFLQASPNAAHAALAALEQNGHLQAVVTQNIDDLHHRAGSQRVIEIHGTWSTSTCTRCFARVPTQHWVERWVHEGGVPHCADCGAILKPDIILFGEQMPCAPIQEARAWMKSCDLCLVVGSSLEVTPAAGLPYEALQAGASLIIINRQPTYLDGRASIVFHDDAAEVLPAVASEVLGERTQSKARQ